MLVFLLLVGLVFVEYRFVITPGITKYEELRSTEADLATQIDVINVKIRIAEQNKEKRDDTLANIYVASQPFLDTLREDILLQYTYELMNRYSYVPTYYSISPIVVSAPNPALVEIQQLKYSLAETVNAYNSIRASSQGDDLVDEPIVNLSEIETAAFIVTATGSYDQLKNLLADIQGLNRTILVSDLSISINNETVQEELTLDPVTGLPVENPIIGEDLYPQENQLIYSFRIAYYGLMKIKPVQDEFNTWPRPDVDSGYVNPFESLPTESEPEVSVVPEETIEGTVIDG